MWIYWILFLWPACAVAVDPRVSRFTSKVAWVLFSLLLLLIIGLRFEVGMDWPSYLVQLEKVNGLTWLEATQGKDPAYGLLNWVAVASGSGIWLVNLICATIFVSGLISICHRLPNTWLAMTVAVPYIAIVMAMNYTRQSAAFGLVLWGLVALLDLKILRFVLLIVVAGLFHKSAILLIPLGALVATQNRFWSLVWITIAAVVAFLALLAETQDAFVEQYLGGQMVSDGGWIRVIMNAVPATLFLMLRKQFVLQMTQDKLFFWLSIISLIFIPAMIMSPSSTAVDRVALYFMPVQLLIYSHLPFVFRKFGMRRIADLALVGTYAFVLFVWLNYSNFHDSWLPYRWYPLEIT